MMRKLHISSDTKEEQEQNLEEATMKQITLRQLRDGNITGGEERTWLAESERAAS